MATTSESGFTRAPNALRLVAGGTVQAQDGVYLRREADARLLDLCRSGIFAYILTSRQMGKSSLLVETARTLAAGGFRTAYIDLTGLGTDPTRDQWYREILQEIGDQLGVETPVPKWWREQSANLSVAQRLNRFLEDVVLREIQENIVIFVDEIDTTLRMDFTDDFFIAIRYFYNARAVNPDLQRLSIVLTGVAAPGDLIKDAERTPFNIGERVELTDFSFEEARPVSEGLGLDDETLERVLEWTGGHPYLTLRVFKSFQDDPLSSWTADQIDRRIADLFFGERSSQDSNLTFVRQMLKSAPKSDQERVLLLYRDIRKAKTVPDENLNSATNWLKLSGVVKRESGVLRVRNRIYAEVFTTQWATSSLKVNWTRRLTRAAAGVAALLVTARFAPVSREVNSRVLRVSRRWAAPEIPESAQRGITATKLWGAALSPREALAPPPPATPPRFSAKI
jgi:AAA-like domain